jgi:nucleotide-binding universal stress UspA family protein/predicted transcriptional regulator
MAFPYRRILNPVDFDENSMAATETAAQFARQNDGTVFLLHVTPIVIQPERMPVYVDIYKGQEDVAREKLRAVARERLQGVKFELVIRSGDPAGTILRAEKRLAADLVVMATHGRRGFSRVFLGSIAEVVLRESTCPVLTVHYGQSDRSLVGKWMTSSPASAEPEEKLSSVAARMHQGGFRSMPVLREGRIVGIVTDRDLHRYVRDLEHTEVKLAMTEQALTVTPQTTIYDAARLLRQRKFGALPVVQDGALVGIISTTDLLEALAPED